MPGKTATNDGFVCSSYGPSSVRWLYSEFFFHSRERKKRLEADKATYRTSGLTSSSCLGRFSFLSQRNIYKAICLVLTITLIAFASFFPFPHKLPFDVSLVCYVAFLSWGGKNAE